MTFTQDVAEVLGSLPGLTVHKDAPLRQYTRFQIGGPAKLFVEASGETEFSRALEVVRASGVPSIVIGGGTNLIVADSGFDGVALRFTGAGLEHREGVIRAEAGAALQELVDCSIGLGLEGMHTMTGIPGWVGGAIYGNAGTYGHSISEFVKRVRCHDGGGVRVLENEDCQFAYRESVFKRRKDLVILSVELSLPPGERESLRKQADEILAIRNAKYPPEMKCAGSIFKNLILKELDPDVRARVPAAVVREGKAPSAWFLEQVGAKGVKLGGIEVAPYHANLIYNSGGGTAAELRQVIGDLKQRVRERFGLQLEEEVQYVGF